MNGKVIVTKNDLRVLQIVDTMMQYRYTKYLAVDDKSEACIVDPSEILLVRLCTKFGPTSSLKTGIEEFQKYNHSESIESIIEILSSGKDGETFKIALSLHRNKSLDELVFDIKKEYRDSVGQNELHVPMQKVSRVLEEDVTKGILEYCEVFKNQYDIIGYVIAVCEKEKNELLANQIFKLLS